MARASTYVTLGLWTIVCLFPLYWVVASSIKAPLEFISNSPHYVPFVDFHPSLHAWREILVDPVDPTLRRFINSILVASGATALTVLTGALGTYGLTRLRASIPFSVFAAVAAGSMVASAGISGSIGLPGGIVGGALTAALVAAAMLRSPAGRWALGPEATFATVLATRLLPPVVTVLPTFYLVQSVGLADTRTALILAYSAANLPIAIWVLRGFVTDIPVDLEEAAQLDGASAWRVFFTITVPLMRRGLVATSLLIFLLCWNEYVLSVYLTAEHAMTMPPFLASQMTSREQMAAAEPDDYAHLAVVIVLMVAPLLSFAGVFRRLMVRIGQG